MEFFQATFPALLEHTYHAAHQAENVWGQS